jgi:hypothetical protein
VKDKGPSRRVDKNYTPRVGLLKKEPHRSGLHQAGAGDEQHAPSSGIQPAPAGQTAENDPYIFGQMQIVPSKEGKYKKTDTLSVVYWCTGRVATRPEAGPDG